MRTRFRGSLGNELNQTISLRGAENRHTDLRTVVSSNPDSTAMRLDVEGGSGIGALRFNGELAGCCHRASPPMLLRMAELATGVEVPASPVLPVLLSRYSQTFSPGPPALFQTAAQVSGLIGSAEVVRGEQRPADPDTAQRLAILEGDELVARARHMRLGDVEPETVQESTSTIPLTLVEGSPLAVPDRVPSGVYTAFAELGLHHRPQLPHTHDRSLQVPHE